MSGEIVTPPKGGKTLADVDLCMRAGAILQREYPNHSWAVGCDHEQGIAYVRLPVIECEIPEMRNVTSFFRLALIGNDTDLRRETVRAGGLLLEALNLKRGAYQPGQYSAEADIETGGAIEFARDSDARKIARVLRVPLRDARNLAASAKRIA